MKSNGFRCSLEDIERFIRLVVVPGSVVELRVCTPKGFWQQGYYDDFGLLAQHAANSSGEAAGVYVTINPVDPTLLHRICNNLRNARQGESTSDKDIIKRTILFIDIDPVRKSGIPANDDEHEAAQQLARDIRAALLAEGWPEPMLVDSGNGAYLLYRIDLPAEDNQLVARVLKTLAARFDTEKVKIDCSVHNPARIARIPGTKNCKGAGIGDRPHRLATIIEAPPRLEPVSRLILESFAGSPSPVSDSPDSFDFGPRQHTGRFDVAAWLQQHSIAYTTEAVENGVLYRLAVCPWKGQTDGRTWIIQRDDGHIIAGCHHAKCEGKGWKSLRRRIDPHFDERTESNAEDGGLDRLDDPHRLAELWWEKTKHSDGSYTYLVHSDVPYVYRKGVWRPITDRRIRAELTRFIRKEFQRSCVEARRAGTTVLTQKVTTTLVNNVLNALDSIALVDEAKQIPYWVDDGPWPANEVLACSNFLVHLTSFASGAEGYMIPLTPRFFSTLNLGYPFDPSGKQPKLWLEFLDQVFPDDPRAILLLQEWFGYNLTLDTSQQALLYMYGQSCGGKGVIVYVLSHIVGTNNVESLKLNALSESHATQKLVGKSLCIFPDAGLSRGTDTIAVVETLKSISGEDPIHINPKHKPPFTAMLTIRIMIISNEVLPLIDHSGALMRRMLLLKFTQDFSANPDTTLREKLLAERPGILLWAIDGWKRLREQRKFTRSASELDEEFKEQISPVRAFVQQRCVIGAIHRISHDDLFKAFDEWCLLRNVPRIDPAQFGKELRSAFPNLPRGTRPREEGGGRKRLHIGIALRPTPENERDTGPNGATEGTCD